MSTRSKGRALEHRVAGILEACGWATEIARPELRYIGPGRVISKAHDLFGVFDLVAKRRFDPSLWVQVTSGGGGNASKRRAAAEEFSRKFIDIGNLGQDRIQVWEWKNTKSYGYHFELQELCSRHDHYNDPERPPGWCSWELLGRIKGTGKLVRPPDVKTESDWNWSFRRIFEQPNRETPLPVSSQPLPPTGVKPLDAF